MTKKKLNREIKDAAAPAIEVVRLLVEQMRQQGQSDAEILAALDRLERDNPAKVDADVMAVVMGEIRKSIVLNDIRLCARQPCAELGWFLRNGPQCFRGWNLQTRKQHSSKVRRIDPLVRAQIEIKLMTCGRFSPP